MSSVPVPCATLDVSKLDQAGQEFHQCRPIQVTLEPGDMLYLPAMWLVLKVFKQCQQLTLKSYVGTTKSLRRAGTMAYVVQSIIGRSEYCRSNLSQF